MNKSKAKRETPLPNTTPTILDGQAFTEDMLRTFLDWSFLNDTKDVRMFMRLWNTGYFKSEPNPHKLRGPHGEGHAMRGESPQVVESLRL